MMVHLQVTLKDGTQVDAFEHGMSISIVALRGSISAQAALDFKSVVGKYAGFALDQRGQIEDIFKARTRTRAAGAGHGALQGRACGGARRLAACVHASAGCARCDDGLHWDGETGAMGVCTAAAHVKQRGQWEYVQQLYM